MFKGSIIILQNVAETAGTVIVSVPSLAVDAAKTVGNVNPPSVDSEIFTAVVAGTEVPPVDQVMVCYEFDIQEIPSVF